MYKGPPTVPLAAILPSLPPSTDLFSSKGLPGQAGCQGQEEGKDQVMLIMMVMRRIVMIMIMIVMIFMKMDKLMIVILSTMNVISIKRNSVIRTRIKVIQNMTMLA